MAIQGAKSVVRGGESGISWPGLFLVLFSTMQAASGELTECDDLTRVPRAHRSAVSQLVLTDEGDLLSGAVDGSLKLWRAATGERRKVLRTHPGGVEGLSLNAAQDQAVSVSKTGLIRSWHLRTGEQLSESSFPSAHTVVFVGRQLLAASQTGLWSRDADQPASRWTKMATQPVVNVAVLPNGRAVSWESDGTARRWSLVEMKEFAVSQRIDGLTATSAINSGQFAVAAAGAIRVLDAETFRVHSSFEAKGVGLLAITPNGQTIVAAQDQTLCLTTVTGKTLASVNLPSPITAIAVSSKLLAVGDARGAVMLFQISAGEMLGVIHDEPSVSPDEMAKRREQAKAAQERHEEELRKTRGVLREQRQQREAAEAARRAELNRKQALAMQARQNEQMRQQQQRFQQWQNPSGYSSTRPSFNGVPLPYGGSVCSRCGRSVSYGSGAGQSCPFCGATWSGVRNY